VRVVRKHRQVIFLHAALAAITQVVPFDDAGRGRVDNDGNAGFLLRRGLQLCLARAPGKINFSGVQPAQHARRPECAGDPPAETVLPVVTNVGRRPTFAGGDKVLAEAHALDWNGDLYGRRVELSFPIWLRAERKFPSVDALRRQIGADADEARRRLAEH